MGVRVADAAADARLPLARGALRRLDLERGRVAVEGDLPRDAGLVRGDVAREDLKGVRAVLEAPLDGEGLALDLDARAVHEDGDRVVVADGSAEDERRIARHVTPGVLEEEDGRRAIDRNRARQLAERASRAEGDELEGARALVHGDPDFEGAILLGRGGDAIDLDAVDGLALDHLDPAPDEDGVGADHFALAREDVEEADARRGVRSLP
jgi:hypothetical protein